jgi:hypothetical protein
LVRRALTKKRRLGLNLTANFDSGGRSGLVKRIKRKLHVGLAAPLFFLLLKGIPVRPAAALVADQARIRIRQLRPRRRLFQ